MADCKTYRVYINRLGHLDYEALIREGLEYIRFGDLITADTKIFIKPNLTFPTYRPGVMTNPDALEAAIKVISDYTSHIFLGDSDSGGYNRFSMDEVYQQTGIEEISKRYGATIVNLSKLDRKAIHFNYAGKQFSLDLPGLLLDDIDLLVTMPVPKIHTNTGVSLTLKNQWGCIPDNKDRLRLHPYFQHVILEVNRAVKSKIAIIDGKFGLTENGPMLGKPVELDWVLISDTIGAGALLACEIMGIPVESVKHLKYAKQQGWIPDWEQITLNQEPEQYKKIQFVLHRKWTDYPGLIAFNSPFWAYIAYFSPYAEFLHQIFYLFRKPFYDYKKSIK